MNLLIISALYPMPDRLGGDNRFFHLLQALVCEHKLTYLAFAPDSQATQYGQDATDVYRNNLFGLGIGILPPGVRGALQGQRYDAVFFQYYTHALQWATEVRTFQPWAHVVVDNGDVAYRRLFSKADLTGDPADRAAAERIKREELTAYRSADAILAVSKEDLDVVRIEIPDLEAYIIPNTHPIPDASSERRESCRLVFVGSFVHPPNVDGIMWFVHEVLPLVVNVISGVRVWVVGYAPTPEVLALASDYVEVVGYVPETAPYLESATISIAPLRFGAGVKGKIGEAMAYRLPVVTTAVGIDGFGLTPGVNILVGETPEEFASHVINLLQDEHLRNNLADAGFQFVSEQFSEPAVNARVRSMMKALPRLPVKRLAFSKRLRVLWDDWMDKNVRWRLPSSR